MELTEAPFRKATDGDVFATPEPLVPLRPLSYRVIVQPLEEPYKGLIIIPPSVRAKEKEVPTRGIVVGLGPGMLTKYGERWPMPDIKPGDIVLFHKHSGIKFEMDGQQYVSVHDSHIIAVLED